MQLPKNVLTSHKFGLRRLYTYAINIFAYNLVSFPISPFAHYSFAFTGALAARASSAIATLSPLPPSGVITSTSWQSSILSKHGHRSMPCARAVCDSLITSRDESLQFAQIRESRAFGSLRSRQVECDWWRCCRAIVVRERIRSASEKSLTQAGFLLRWC
jgi:transposase